MSHLFRKPPLYQPVSAEEEWQPSTHRRRKGSLVIWILTATLLLLNALAVFPILYSKWAVSRQHPSKPCGESWQQAEARGCRYNIMMSAWLPPNCFDDDLTEEFTSIADWEFWADANRTEPLTIEETSKRSTPIRASPEYFHAHCAFSFRKLQRAIEQNREVEVELSRLERATQCQQFMLGRVPNPDGKSYESMEDGEIWFNVMFPQCVSARGWWSL